MIIEILGDGIIKEDAMDKPLRIGARAVVKKGDLFLMVHQEKDDIYTLPGGGVENDETNEEACIREVLEETGVAVNVIKHTVTLKEYFSDSRWEHHYFLCEYIDKVAEPNLVEYEIVQQLKTKWMTFDEIMDQFENNMTKHEWGPAIHQREFLGIINSI